MTTSGHCLPTNLPVTQGQNVIDNRLGEDIQVVEVLLWPPWSLTGLLCKKPLSYWLPGDVRDSVSGSIGSFLNGQRAPRPRYQGQGNLPIETFGNGLHVCDTVR